MKVSAKDFLYYPYRILKWKLGDTSPMCATAKLTYRCNLNCRHCPWKQRHSCHEATTADWQKTFTSLYRRGVRFIAFEGGEPTLRRDIGELITSAQDRGLKVVLVTNGTQDLSKLYPDGIFLSIDGNEKIHDLLRGKGVFQKAMAHVVYRNAPCVTITTVSRLNRKILKETLDLVQPHVEASGFNMLYPYTGDAEKLALTKTERESVWRELRLLSFNYRLINTPGMMDEGPWECTPWMLDFCEPDGRVTHHTGCFIENTGDKPNCDACDLGCYRGYARLAKGDLDCWRLMYRYLIKSTTPSREIN